jgi:energy-coupling factor transporter ATP-binding protein EcfA2
VIRAISIKNLRGIREGRLEGFTNLVVLVGPNNSGKSTVLDALFVGASADPQDSLKSAIDRRLDFEQGFQWFLFRDKGRMVGPAEIVIRSDAPESRMTKIHHIKNNSTEPLITEINSVSWKSGRVPASTDAKPLSVRSIIQKGTPIDDVPEIGMVDAAKNGHSLPDLYTLVAERGLTKQAKSIVTDLLPDVLDIEILTQQGHPIVYVVYQNGAQPLALTGDGVRVLLQQSLELAAPAGGVMLLEEPEVHLHPGAIRQSARAMLAAVTRGIQVIFTTHSLELIDSLLSESKTEDLDKLSFYRLQLKDGILKSYRHSGTEASRARTQIEDDLR